MANFIEVTPLPEDALLNEKRFVNIDKIYQVKYFIDPNGMKLCRIDFVTEYLNSNTVSRGQIITKETYDQVVEMIKTQTQK